MRDRVPSFPGRVTLTPVSGQANTYDMVRADAPVEVGTPLNKSTLMPDALATQLGLNPATATPAEGIGAAAERAKVKVGSIVSSVRDDFKAEVAAGVYVPCNGQVFGVTAYPQLATVAAKIAGNIWGVTTVASDIWSDVIKTNTGRIIAANASTKSVSYSDDNGKTWVQSAINSDIQNLTIGANNRIIAASVGNKGLSYSDNNGATFTKSSKTDESFNDIITLSNGRIIACLTYRYAWYSDDNGVNWNRADITGDFLEVRSLIQLENGRVLAGTSNGLYRSDDNGLSWQLHASIGGIRALCIGNNGKIFAGNITGNTGSYYASVDGGATFTMQSTIGTSSQILTFFCAKGRVFAGTFSSGIWYSDDNGTTWTKSNTTTLGWYAFEVGADGVIIGASTGGIWRSPEAICIPNIPNFYVKVKES